MKVSQYVLACIYKYSGYNNREIQLKIFPLCDQYQTYTDMKVPLHTKIYRFIVNIFSARKCCGYIDWFTRASVYLSWWGVGYRVYK